MYVVGNYPNQYDDILIEIFIKEDRISDIGLVLDGLTPSRPHLQNEDFQFIYDFLSSVSKSGNLRCLNEVIHKRKYRNKYRTNMFG